MVMLLGNARDVSVGDLGVGESLGTRLMAGCEQDTALSKNSACYNASVNTATTTQIYIYTVLVQMVQRNNFPLSVSVGDGPFSRIFRGRSPRVGTESKVRLGTVFTWGSFFMN